MLRGKTNEDLARTALDALYELERRGNVVGQASEEVARFLKDVLGLKELAAMIEEGLERDESIEIELTNEVSTSEYGDVT